MVGLAKSATDTECDPLHFCHSAGCGSLLSGYGAERDNHGQR